MKRLFFIFAAAVMVVGCNQNPPSVGETGTVTPVDDPTEPVDPDKPANSIHISYVRNDSLKYTFTGKVSSNLFTNTAIVQWDFLESSSLKLDNVQMEPPYVVTHTFSEPGTALIILSTLSDNGNNEYVKDQSASIIIDVY